MGKKPLMVVPRLFLAGLGLFCVASIGCTGSGPKPLVKPAGRFTDASNNSNAWSKPPASVGNNGLPPTIAGGQGTNLVDGTKVPPPPPVPSISTANRTPIQPVGATTTQPTPQFDQGPKVPPGNPPGNPGAVGTGTSPSSYLDTPSKGVFPPNDLVGAGAGLRSNPIPPPPAVPGREPVGQRMVDPGEIPGAPTAPAISTTTNYGANTIRTAPTPPVPAAEPYLAPGSSNFPQPSSGVALPPIGGNP